MRQHVSHWRAEFALVCITGVWGLTFVIVKDALEHVSTLLFLTLRFSLAAIILAILYRKHLYRFGKLPLRAGIIAGLLLFTGQFFQTQGLRYTTPSKSAFITGLSIVLVPLLSGFVYRKAPGVFEIAGIVVATLGLALMTIEPGALTVSIGDLLTLICAFAFGAHIVAIGYFASSVNFEALSALQISTAAGASALTFWWAEVPTVQWTAGVVGAVAVTGLLATALAFTVQAWAQRFTTATRVALIFALEPVFAALTSHFLGRETITKPIVAGAVLILAGILLVELKPSAGPPHPSG